MVFLFHEAASSNRSISGELKSTKKSSSSWRQEACMRKKKKDRNISKEEKAMWKFENAKDFLHARKENSWVIPIILEGSNLVQLQNTKLLLSTLKYLVCSQPRAGDWALSRSHSSTANSQLWLLASFKSFTWICTAALDQNGALETLYFTEDSA